MKMPFNISSKYPFFFRLLFLNVWSAGIHLRFRFSFGCTPFANHVTKDPFLIYFSPPLSLSLTINIFPLCSGLYFYFKEILPNLFLIPLLLKDGTHYEGQWHEDFKHGIGTMRFANGDVYKGSWQNGLMHGQGKMFFSDGSKYEVRSGTNSCQSARHHQRIIALRYSKTLLTT